MTRTARRTESGFTLVELLVVVAILGILAAIAVGALLKAQNGAKTKAATSNLRTALTSAKTMRTETETYLVSTVEATVTKLAEHEPSLQWQSDPATTATEISVQADADTAALADRKSTRLNSSHGYISYA